PNDVVVALARIELQRKSARISPRVRAATLTCNSGETDQRVGLCSRLEHGGLGVGTEVFGNFEISKGPRSLSMRLTLGDSFPVKVGHLLNQIVVLQKNGTIWTTVSEYSSLATGIPAS